MLLSSSQNWPVIVRDAATNTQVSDPDGDDVYDLGSFQPGQTRSLIVTLGIPAGTGGGTTDILTLAVPADHLVDPVTVRTTATGSDQIATDTPTDATQIPGATETPTADGSTTATPEASASATGTASPTATSATSLSISGSADFGNVDILGHVDPSVSGVTSTTDDQGATYIRSRAIRITVTSDTTWSVSCSLTGASSALTGDGLTWSVHKSGEWHTFADDGEGAICASGGPGSTTVVLDLSLRVNFGDPPDPLSGTIHISLKS